MKILKGVISGIIGGIVFILVNFLVRIPFSKILAPYHDEIALILRPEIIHPSINFFITIYIIYIIIGVIIALFYLMIKNSIPGKNFFIKGIILGLFIWFFIALAHSTFVFIEFRMPLIPLLIGTFIFDLIGILISTVVIALILNKDGKS